MDMFGSAEHSRSPLNCLLTYTESLTKQSNLQEFFSLSQRHKALSQFQVGLWDGIHNGDVTQQKQFK